MREERALSKFVRPLTKGQITLPIEFRRRLQVGSDTILRVTLKGGRIEVVPLRPMGEHVRLREYENDEIGRFLREDRLDARTAAKVRRLLSRKPRT